MNTNKNQSMLYYIFLALVIYLVFTYFQQQQNPQQINNQKLQRDQKLLTLKENTIISQIREKNINKYIPKTLTGDIVTCNTENVNCKAYTSRDTNSICPALCNPSIYTGNSTKNSNVLSCECSNPITQSNFSEPKIIEKFTVVQRSQLEENDIKRQSKLIFGI